MNLKTYYEPMPVMHKRNGNKALCNKSQLGIRLTDDNSQVECEMCLKRIENGNMSKEETKRMKSVGKTKNYELRD